MAETPSEGRALSAALSAAVPFRTRVGDGLLHSADRHVGRLAPDAGPQRPRALTSLAFVDRLVVPWVMAAQQSASMRLFGEYVAHGPGERAARDVSWVFPRPWYQDELDWMAAARMGGGGAARGMFTTRGTFESRQAPVAAAAPSALEYVAPSLAQPVDAARAWSPLYGADAMARAQLMQIAVDASGGGAGRQLATTALAAMAPAMVGAAPGFAASTGSSMTAGAMATQPAGSVPALRARLAALIASASTATEGGAGQDQPMSRLVGQVPTMVMPAVVAEGFGPDRAAAESAGQPAPAARGFGASGSARAEEAARIAEASRMAEIARVETARVYAARAEAARIEAARGEAARGDAARSEAVRVEAARAEAARADVARIEAARLAAASSATPSTTPSTSATPGANIPGMPAMPMRAEEQVALERARDAAQRQAEYDARARVEGARAAETERAQQAYRYAEAQRAAIDTQRAIMLQMEQAQRAAVAQRAEHVAAQVAQAQAAQSAQAQAAQSAQAQALAQAAQAQAAQSAQAQAQAAAASESMAMPVGLRMVELLARGLESGRAPTPIAGPRVALPAGLGGLVAATGPAAALGAMSTGRSMPIGAWLPPPPVMTATDEPAMAEAPRSAALARPSFALPAVVQTRPQVLEHVAWADRWLGRMAGAQPRALAAFDAATDSVTAMSPQAMSMRPSQRAAAAPMPVFVAPADLDGVSRTDAVAAMTAQAELRASRPEPAAPNVVRFADDDETPDDVLFAIAAARAADAPRGRTASAASTAAQAHAPTSIAAIAAAASTAGAARTVAPAFPVERLTPADHVLTSVPLAPGAGFAPALAASPIAPALASLLPLPPVASFDVRALFGAELASAYLGGMLATSAFAVDEHGALASASAPWSALAGSIGRFAPPELTMSTRAMAAPAMDVVAPVDFGADVDMRYFAADVHAGGSPRAAYRADGPFSGVGDVATLRPALLLPQPTATAPIAAADPTDWSSAVGPYATAAAIASLPGHYPLPRTDEAAAIDAGGAFGGAAAETAWMPGASAAAGAPLWSARPGMTAERSRRWAAHTQHAAADLALDFVSPELVLAARVYGLSPADAAQATRLATGGPTALQVLAGQVELTFLRALAADAELRGESAGHAGFSPSAGARRGGSIGFASTSDAMIPTTAYPVGDAAAMAMPSAMAAMAMPSMGGSTTTPAAAALASALPATSRRTPRGAFLWPAATVGAIGLHAPVPDGDGALSIAALELLAAGAVAQLGTYAIQHGATAEEAAQLIMARGGIAALPGIAAAGAPGVQSAPGFAPSAVSGSSTAAATAAAEMSIDATESDAAAMAAVTPLGSSERARFQALYVALTQSTAGRELSPVARAARALAMTSRADEGGVLSTRERAALAWSMMPVVEAGALSPEVIAALTSAGFDASAIAAGASPAAGGTTATAGTTASPSWAMRAPDLTALSLPAGGPGYADDGHADLRPGLAPLSHRAGEALSSFVTPLATPAAPAPAPAASTSSASTSAASRAPSQEIVKAITSRGRYGGGEVEIPPWFEQAARKMLETRGAGDGISLAELTLVTAAPSTHVAASTRGPSSATSAVPTVATPPAKPGMPDIEKLAREVYDQVLAMMRMAHQRNSGDM